MTINPDNYRRRKGKGPRKAENHAKMVNIRVRRRGKTPPTRTEVRQAVLFALDHGRMPPGWQMAAIDWRSPRDASPTWSEDITDLLEFRPLILAMIDDARISPVRQ
jgi:hypothetical protein